MSKYFEIDAQSKFISHRVMNQTTYEHTESDIARLIYSDDDERLYIGGVNNWIAVSTPYDILDQGTKMLFGAYPLPTGWNLDTSWNDRVALLDTNASQIGTTGGSWTITGIFGSGSHNHNLTHDWATTQVNVDYGQMYVSSVYHGHFTATEPNHTHAHTPGWRPYNIRYCVGEYQ